MKQKDIINELNRLVVGYNINWDMIKYDADKAIMKINAYLGAEYPMMSDIMLSDEHRYTIRYNNKDIPIFPERYILTVVIPYIATEVLSRDEEFTTIYNKYVMDYENGLFDMFQNEFNKVPPVFRQDKDIGVFFSADTKERAINTKYDETLPDFKFNVYYHLNVEDYNPLQQFTTDLNKYEYGSDMVVFSPTFGGFIKDIYAYNFKGWSTSPTETVIYNPGDTIKVKHDIHLYAQWESECVLECLNSAGAVHIKQRYADRLITLNIPPYVDGKVVKIIPNGFLMYATNLLSLTLPRTNVHIQPGAIGNGVLQTLILPSYDYLREHPSDVKISAGAIYNHKLTYLYVPYSVSVIESGALNGIPSIRCEIERRPSKWSEDWTNSTDVKWGVANG